MNTSTTPPSSSQSGNAAARYFFLFLIGLVVGAIAVVMIMRAAEQRKTWQDHYPDSVMHVMDAHMELLGANVQQNRCSATDTLPHLQTLRIMANDIEFAFGDDFREDARFAKHASNLRATLDGTLSSPPLNCAGAGTSLKEIGGKCKACHQDFRN